MKMGYLKNTLLIVFIIFILINAASAELVVVAHKNNDWEDLSIDELKKIFQGNSTAFDNEREIQITEIVSYKEYFYSKLLNQTVKQMKKHWMRLIFSGQFIKAPKEFKNNETFNDYFSSNENCIGYLDEKDVTGDMKIIKLNGKLPGQTGYFFSDDIEK